MAYDDAMTLTDFVIIYVVFYLLRFSNCMDLRDVSTVCNCNAYMTSTYNGTTHDATPRTKE